MKARIPNREAERLEALRQYAILDTPPEQAYDDFTALAAYICEVPIAMISLVDENRQWFKSKVGLETCETPRDISFCSHAILKKDVMVINDALADERFATNPLVTSELGIRFYAGAPLINPEGFSLGYIVRDRSPASKSITKANQSLEAIARQVVSQMELRRVSAAIGKCPGKDQAN
jgi:GAF domain-containing protein